MNTCRTLRTFGAVATAATLVLLGAPGASAHGNGDAHLHELADEAGAAPEALPNTSDTVDYVTTVPGTAGISGCFTPTAPYFVSSGLDSVTVYDASQPRAPRITGKLVNAVFENEAMNCGERRIDGKVHRFALIGVDLYQASPGDPDHTNVNEDNELIVVDVTNPARPHIQSRTPVSSSTHTVTCVDDRRCRTVYTAGSSGRFSVLNLTNLDRPREIDFVPGKRGKQGHRSPVIGWGGHSWDTDSAGFGLHTGAGGTAVFDLSTVRDPRLLTTTGAAGDNGDDPAPEDDASAGWNDFIHHNSWRPRARAFRAHAPASLANGNVLLVTEEDYEQTDCTKAGSFQTWKIKALRGPGQGIVRLDKVELTDLGNYPLPGPIAQGAFCSAHWFDYHPSGLVAVGYYGGGTQIVDVRNPRDIKSYGHAFWGASEVWDSYWVPRYRNGHRVGQSNVIYSVDAVRGLDVYSVDLPGGRTESSAGSTGAAATGGTVPPSAIALALVALPLAAVLRRRARGHRPSP